MQKQDDALITNDTIKVLLVNILPSHVGKLSNLNMVYVILIDL